MWCIFQLHQTTNSRSNKTKEVAERHRRQTWQLSVAMGQQRPFSCSCRRCPVLPVDGWTGRCRPAVDDYCRSRIGQQRPPSRQRHHRNRHRQNASSTETNTRNVHLTLTLLYCKKWIDQNSFSWNWNVKWKHQRQDEESAKKIIALVCCQFKNKFHHSLGVISNSSIHFKWYNPRICIILNSSKCYNNSNLLFSFGISSGIQIIASTAVSIKHGQKWSVSMVQRLFS